MQAATWSASTPSLTGRKGRGKQLAAPPVKELAQKYGIPVYQPLKLRQPEAVAELEALAPDLIVVVAYGQILPKSVLEIPAHGCINVHASLLPKYRGAAPINKAIIDGETETGITTMYMDVGLDTGDMLVKKTLSIGADETAGELHDRLASLGRETMEETLRQLCAGTLQRKTQDDEPEHLRVDDEKRRRPHRLESLGRGDS